MTTPDKKSKQVATASKINVTPYLAIIPPEVDPARRLLERYSGITPEEVDVHIHEIRDKAWSVFPYGCVGSFWFLNLVPTIEDARFQTVAARLQAPDSTETFLDVGCCVGPVIRYLIAEGVSSERLYGTDLQPHFLDLGYELFRDWDQSKSRATFVAGDMLQENDTKLDALAGKIDIIYTSAFFHLFEREGQFKAAKQMIRFLRPENPRAMIFGRNEGPMIVGWEKYLLDAESWQQMWDEAGKATGTRWRTEMDVESSDEWNKVRFGVYRVS